MTKRSGRSNLIIGDNARYKLADLLLEQFKGDMGKNSIEYAAALTYFFSTVYAYLTEAVEQTLGLTIILSAMIIIWYMSSQRMKIKDKYSKKITLLLSKEKVKLEDILNFTT